MRSDNVSAEKCKPDRHHSAFRPSCKHWIIHNRLIISRLRQEGRVSGLPTTPKPILQFLPGMPRRRRVAECWSFRCRSTRRSRARPVLVVSSGVTIFRPTCGWRKPTARVQPGFCELSSRFGRRLALETIAPYQRVGRDRALVGWFPTGEVKPGLQVWNRTRDKYNCEAPRAMFRSDRLHAGCGSEETRPSEEIPSAPKAMRH